MPALVEGVDVEVRLERDAERVPRVRVPREAVQQEQRRSALAAPVEQVEAETLTEKLRSIGCRRFMATLSRAFGPGIKRAPQMSWLFGDLA